MRDEVRAVTKTDVEVFTREVSQGIRDANTLAGNHFVVAIEDILIRHLPKLGWRWGLNGPETNRAPGIPEHYGAIIVECMALYFYNVEPTDQIKMLFPDAVDSYVHKWLELYTAGFETFWGSLDAAHKLRYMRVAMDRYFVEAGRRIPDNEKGVGE